MRPNDKILSYLKTTRFLNLKLDWNANFIKVSKPHWNDILRFAFSLCHDKDDANDLLQATLLKAFKAFPTFVEKNTDPEVFNAPLLLEKFLNQPEFQRHIKNWLFKITKNSFLDSHAVQKRWRKENDESELENLEANPDATDSSFSDSDVVTSSNVANQQKAFYREALDDHWKTKLDVLTERQRSILFLAAEDYSYKEIAEILTIPIGTVMSNLSRTLKKLKSLPN